MKSRVEVDTGAGRFLRSNDRTVARDCKAVLIYWVKKETGVHS